MSRADREVESSSRGLAFRRAGGLNAGRRLLAVLSVETELPELLHRLADAVSGSFRVQRFSSLTEIAGGQSALRSCIDLVLVNSTDGGLRDGRTQMAVLAIRHRLPGVPIVLVCPCRNSRLIQLAFSFDVSGVIPEALDPSIAIAAINLVLAGGFYVPDILVDLGASSRASEPADLLEGEPATRDANLDCLTPRQNQVLRLLYLGKSNKEIARALGMEENTVKVHVRGILKKLNVSNRTQAAFIAAQG